MTSTSDKSLGELLGDLTRETSTLFRQEVNLAKAEMTEKVSMAVKGSALLIVAAVLGLFAFQALMVTAVLALATVVSPWLAAFIVAGVLLVIAAICGLVGAGRLKNTTPVPRQTVQTLKEDVRWAKEQLQ